MSTPLVAILKNVESSLLKPTALADTLPDASDLAFERTLSRPLARQLDAESARILALVGKVLAWTEGGNGKELDGEMIREGVYSDVIERVEKLLEGADDSIEKHLGVGKHKAGVGALGAKLDRPIKEAKKPLPAHLLLADIPKPQLLFPPRLVHPRPLVTETDPSTPFWKPLLRTKPHALDPTKSKSRKDFLVTEVYTPTVKDPNAPLRPPRVRYAHPYADEYDVLSPPESYFIAPSVPLPISPTSFTDVPFEWVNTPELLKKMLDEIREVGLAGEKELAVDLEHHDLRSWTGICCLLQLSTRRKDYVVDVLDPAVRDALEGLNEFFANPTWIKVFHGAQSDIIWLQRDFGLYIVGLFDTYHATHVLNYPQHSLLSLLNMFTSFEADKRYQLADWRIRPVPQEMLHYARSDTHFLLAIYDHIRLALHALALNPPPPSTDPDAMPIDPPTAQSLLSEVYRRSTKTSSNIFEISPYDSKLGMGQDGWRSILNRTAAEKQYETALAVPTLPIKTGWGEGEVKLEVLRAIHAWRETTARREDEGVRYLLSKEGIWAIVEHTPRTGLEVMQVLAKTRSGVSEWVRQNKDEVAEVVVAALGKVTVGKVRMVEGEEEVEVERKEGKARESASQPAVAPLGGLWDAPAVVAVPIKAAKSTPFGAVRAATSSFFGGRAPPAVVAPIVVVAPVATKSSSLFARASSFFSGKQEPKVSKSSPDVVMLDVPPLAVVETASQKVARVHASLVLGGGLANSLNAHSVPEPVPVIRIVKALPVLISNPASASMDHSFVAFSDRLPTESTNTTSSIPSPLPTPKSTDVLVVSSFTDKPKKRSRKREESGGEETPKKKKEKKEKKEKKVKEMKSPLERLAPFDYDGQKSILDAEPEKKQELGGGKKDKKKKEGSKKGGKFSIDTSEFRREPRVNNAPKSGAVTASFAK